MVRDDALDGILCALVTPLAADGEQVNTVALHAVIDYVLDGGCTGVVVLGGTGEYTALSTVERERAVATTVDRVNGRVPVVVGIVAPGLGDAKDMARVGERVGADYLMPVTPYYAHPTQQGLLDWYSTLVESTSLPLILYNIPARTGVNLQPETVLHLAEVTGRIAGIKECTADLGQFAELMQLAGDRMSILAGEEFFALAEFLLGARGAILASANLVPHLWVRLHGAASSGRYDDARQVYATLLPLLRALFAETNPGPLKHAMSQVGLAVGPAALPLLPPPIDLRDRLEAALSRLDVGVRG